MPQARVARLRRALAGKVKSKHGDALRRPRAERAQRAAAVLAVGVRPHEHGARRRAGRRQHLERKEALAARVLKNALVHDDASAVVASGCRHCLRRALRVVGGRSISAHALSVCWRQRELRAHTRRVCVRAWSAAAVSTLAGAAARGIRPRELLASSPPLYMYRYWTTPSMLSRASDRGKAGTRRELAPRLDRKLLSCHQDDGGVGCVRCGKDVRMDTLQNGRGRGGRTALIEQPQRTPDRRHRRFRPGAGVWARATDPRRCDRRRRPHHRPVGGWRPGHHARAS